MLGSLHPEHPYPHFQAEALSMGRHGNVKSDKKYEALRRKGMSKQRAAKSPMPARRAAVRAGSSRTARG